MLEEKSVNHILGIVAQNYLNRPQNLSPEHGSSDNNKERSVRVHAAAVTGVSTK